MLNNIEFAVFKHINNFGVNVIIYTIAVWTSTTYEKTPPFLIDQIFFKWTWNHDLAATHGRVIRTGWWF